MSSKRSVLQSIKTLAQEVAFLLEYPPIDPIQLVHLGSSIALAIGTVRALPCLEKYEVIGELTNAEEILLNTTLYPDLQVRLSLALQLIQLAALKAQLLNCGCCK